MYCFVCQTSKGKEKLTTSTMNYHKLGELTTNLPLFIIYVMEACMRTTSNTRNIPPVIDFHRQIQGKNKEFQVFGAF